MDFGDTVRQYASLANRLFATYKLFPSIQFIMWIFQVSFIIKITSLYSSDTSSIWCYSATTWFYIIESDCLHQIDVKYSDLSAWYEIQSDWLVWY